jgi:hypothetical protein
LSSSRPATEGEEHLSRFERFEEWYFSKSRIWLWTGFAIVMLGLLLGATRDINELTLTNLVVIGVSNGGIYQTAVTVDTLIQHSTEQTLLLAMSLFKLGIGGYIYFIVRNLESTGKHSMNRLAPDAKQSRRPFFRNLFPRLLVLGTDVQLINVGIIMVIWDLNALNLLHLQFIGQTSGAAYAQALTIERLIGSLVVPVEMFGATFMLTGIPLGLASIVYNLRLQLRTLPSMLGSFMVKRLGFPPAYFPATVDQSASAEISAKRIVPRKTLATTLTAFAIGISGLIVIAPIRTVNLGRILSDEFAGQASSTSYLSAVLFERLAGVTTEQWLFLGLGLVIFSINLWLLHIIKALEGTREVFSEILTSTTGSRISQVERNLWPKRLVLPLAATGLAVMVVNLILGLAADSTIVAQYQAQLTGATKSTAFEDAVINGGVFLILARNIKFLSFGFLLLGVGFSLVTIIINLRLTASTFLNVFPRLMTFVASGGRRKENPDEVSLPRSMSLAPWRLFAVIALGGSIAISAFFSFGVFDALSFVKHQGLAFEDQSSSNGYVSALLAERLWEHTLLPWKLLGMGMMLFGIGRTFGVIVGFVKARTTAIRELIESITVMAEQRTGETKSVESS